MTLIRHELRQNWKSLIIWTLSIGFFVAICVFLYPEMENEMEGVNDMFSSMGSFTAAFGMDRLNFGTLIGFYAVECGNILGIGGAFFASLIGINALAKEEKERTAEFLLTHPINRIHIITGKLVAVLIQILMMNIVIFILSIASIAAIGEGIPWKEITLLHLSYFLIQIELSGICFGISAFLRHGGLGIGLGLATIMYFLNIIANISESAKFLKYITPFGYAEGADIIADMSLDTDKILLGIIYMSIAIFLAYWKYSRKDIQ
ncbi:MAG: ABC transporter permease [Eubacterium sp.]|nr:ABC transporter permease [Eubacterium sp.]